MTLLSYNYKFYQSPVIDNLTIVKKLGQNYKIITMKIPVRRGGYEIKRNKKNTINEKKLLNNLIRAKTTVREYALCNDFEYFCTFTLDKKKYNRYDLKKFIKDLGQFIRDYRKKYETDIQYILIPEQHKDGAWHMHGLFKGISQEHIKNFDDIPTAPSKLKGKEYYNFTLYEKKFGFNSMGKIKDKEKVANYITKYITKDLGENIELGNKTYYVTRGLNKAKTIKKGTLVSPLNYEFENEYCKLTTTKNIDNIIINEI